MDGPRDYHTKWSKSDRERQIPHETTYMWNLKCDTNEQTQTHRHRKQTYGYQRRKRVKRDKVRVRDNENVNCSLFETPWTVTYHVPLSKGFPGKNTGVGSHSLLQESSQPRDWAWVYCIADRFFTVWAIREGQDTHYYTVCCSVSRSCPTLCNPMDFSVPDFPALRCLLEFAQTRVHWVGDDIQPSHALWPPSLPAFNLSQHQSDFMIAVSNTIIYTAGKQQGPAVCYRKPYSSLSGNNLEENVKK